MNPVILLVADDHGDLLRGEFDRYRRDYELRSAGSPDEMVRAVDGIIAAGDQLALLVADTSVFPASDAGSWDAPRCWASPVAT